MNLGTIRRSSRRKIKLPKEYFKSTISTEGSFFLSRDFADQIKKVYEEVPTKYPRLIMKKPTPLQVKIISLLNQGKTYAYIQRKLKTYPNMISDTKKQFAITPVLENIREVNKVAEPMAVTKEVIEDDEKMSQWVLDSIRSLNDAGYYVLIHPDGDIHASLNRFTN